MAGNLTTKPERMAARMTERMALSWLFFWRRRDKRAGRMRVRLYTRAGCHLCDTAWHTLQQAQARWGFQLDAVDIDTDKRLVTLYGEWAPVVVVDERVRFRGQVNPVLLERLLRAESAAR